MSFFSSNFVFALKHHLLNEVALSSLLPDNNKKKLPLNFFQENPFIFYNSCLVSFPEKSSEVISFSLYNNIAKKQFPMNKKNAKLKYCAFFFQPHYLLLVLLTFVLYILLNYP